MKAIIYCRKSSESDEKQVQSIEAQLDWCREYTKRVGFEVVKEITEEKSAKKPWREWFNELMWFFSEKKADVIVSWKLNRLARNPVDEWTIKWLSQQFIINEIHTVDWISNWHNILLMSVHFGMATQFLIDLSKDIKRWMDKKAKNGWWGRRSPLWYNVKDWKITVDDQYSPYIKKIFKLKYEDKLNNAEIARRLSELWLKTRKEKKKGTIVWWKKIDYKWIGRILANPFYYWVIPHLWELFEWHHEPLINKEIWDAVNNKDTKQYNFYKKWILKWKVIFKDTKKPMCVTEKIKKNKTNDKVRKYIFYHTAWDNQTWYSELNIKKLFDENIESYCIPKEYTESIKNALLDYHYNKIEENYNGKKEMQKLIDKLETKKRTYSDMRANGELTHDEFIEIKNWITNEIIDLRNRSNEIERLDEEILWKLSGSVELLVNLSSKRKWLNNDQKLTFINCMLVELVINKEKKAFISEKPLFEFIRKTKNCHMVELSKVEVINLFPLIREIIFSNSIFLVNK